MSSTTPPFAEVTDDQLWNMQVALALACGRNHSILHSKRRQSFCALQRVLDVEADLRGVPSPHAPYGVGDLKPGAL